MGAGGGPGGPGGVGIGMGHADPSIAAGAGHGGIGPGIGSPGIGFSDPGAFGFSPIQGARMGALLGPMGIIGAPLGFAMGFAPGGDVGKYGGGGPSDPFTNASLRRPASSFDPLAQIMQNPFEDILFNQSPWGGWPSFYDGQEGKPMQFPRSPYAPAKLGIRGAK